MYDRFVTLVKMANLSVAWQMNMWMLKNGSQKTAVKLGRVEKSNFKVPEGGLGLLFFVGKVAKSCPGVTIVNIWYW